MLSFRVKRPSICSLTIKCIKQVKHDHLVEASQTTDSSDFNPVGVLCNASLRATAGCQSKVTLTHDYSSVAVTLKGTREHHSVSCCSFLQTERVGSVKYKQIIDREAVCSLYSTKGAWLCDLQRYTSLRPRIITQAKIR